jgi:hypothetical protein
MSSVRGLKASPQIAKRLPERSSPNSAATFSTRRRFCASFTSSTALSSGKGMPFSCAVWTAACTSFGKHEPPYPTPGNRKWWPIRRS